MSTHTPGSFNPSLFTQSIDKVVGEYRAAWRKGKPGSIGAVEQAEQYARLIAAAPALLEALEYAEGWADLLPDDAATKVRAAIAQAKGESHA